MRRTRSLTCALLLVLIGTGTALAQTPKAMGPDLTKTPTLYVVPYAHLDTEWRWDYPTTISAFLPKTMKNNFALFEKYPGYIFNFSGANRYRMMKEYYPAEYAQVKEWVAKGRWFPSGSSMEENDVNNPSAESIMRQVLYGTHWFRAEFGKTSAEYMLPDCFGFPASLPSILAHMGLKGFSTQKLTWRSAAESVGGPESPQGSPKGIPFNVGYWAGLDGHGVVAALNAMDYSGDVTYDISKAPPPPVPPASPLTDWPARIAHNGTHGLLTDYYYYGTGDTGGSPRDWSIGIMEAILNRGETGLPLPGQRSGEGAPIPQMGAPVKVGDGPVYVVQTTSERMFLDIRPEWLSKLPRYTGDLELIEHSAGSLTSEAYMKRWNRQNEVLADAAERASVAAMWLGRSYPQKRLDDAWTLVMGGQFHDIIPGTSLPKAYEYAWNDQVLALNQFAAVLTNAAEKVASGLDTRVTGTPVVVYNPLNVARADAVEATLPFAGPAPGAVRVFGPDGREVPAQISGNKVVFIATVPAVGWAVYDVRPAAKPEENPGLVVTASSLENERYAIKLDANGDVASIFDRKLRQELLAGPARLALTTDKPAQWPAWNMDWNDESKPPRAYVGGPARIRVVESGPARVAVEIAREAEGSRFVQTIRLAAGSGRVEFVNALDWHTPATNLKAAFPLTASNPLATYNWDVGTIQRGNDAPNKFEVASHQWVDLTDANGKFGVTLLTDAKNGSDKPDDSTLRLTLVRTPGISAGWEEYGDQSTQDFGHHEFVYGLAGHAGDWRQEHSIWEALRLNQPLAAFTTGKHAGALGRELSLMHLSTPAVRVLALKKAEASDEVVIRLVETEGRPQTGVTVTFAAPVVAARTLNGQELPIKGPARIVAGKLVTDFTPYEPRTFAVRLAPAPARLAPARAQPLTLAYDAATATTDGAASSAGFDGTGRSLPAEMLPGDVEYAGIHFHLAPAATGKPNAVVPRGQTVALPAGRFNRLYILAASSAADHPAVFKVGATDVTLPIQSWGGYVGQWDNREWKQVAEVTPDEPAPGDTSRAARRARETRERIQKEGPRMYPEFTGVLEPGFVKPATVAWFASHQHKPDGSNDPYHYAYLFAYTVELPAGATSVTLPDDARIRILAMTAADQAPAVARASVLFDDLRREATRTAAAGQRP